MTVDNARRVCHSDVMDTTKRLAPVIPITGPLASTTMTDTACEFTTTVAAVNDPRFQTPWMALHAAQPDLEWTAASAGGDQVTFRFYGDADLETFITTARI